MRLGLEYLLPRFPAMSGLRDFCRATAAADEENALRYGVGILRGTRPKIADFPSMRAAKRYARAVRCCSAPDYFEELRSLPEGRGGGVVVKRHAEKVTLFPARHPAELMDADTPDVLAELKMIFQNDSFYR